MSNDDIFNFMMSTWSDLSNNYFICLYLVVRSE